MGNEQLSGSRLPSQLKTEHEILALLRPIYSELGHDPTELIKVAPSWGGWLNALRFCVVRADGATTWVSRKDLDGLHEQGLIAALKAFSHASAADCLVIERATSEQVSVFDRQVKRPQFESATPQPG